MKILRFDCDICEEIFNEHNHALGNPENKENNDLFSVRLRLSRISPHSYRETSLISSEYYICTQCLMKHDIIPKVFTIKDQNDEKVPTDKLIDFLVELGVKFEE